MGRHSALLVLIAGCGFSAHASSNSGGDDTPTIDAAVPGDTAIDGAPPCVRGFLDLCGQPDPSIPTLDITSAKTIDTDRDPLCHRVGQSGGGDVCLIYATDVRITSAGSITAFGSRPLALAASSTLTIDGAIDVGSHAGRRGPAADATGCSFARSPDSDTGGGGGGAGGGFTLPGGDGGTGDQNNNGGNDGTALPGLHGTTTKVSVLRGGCAGQTGGDESGGGGNGGRGGDSGGALYLFARQRLQIAGDLRATGAGASGGQVQSGGGGGGTGGLVVIESPSLTISGRISANGGGGGQGGARLGTGGNGGGTIDVSGNPGEDGNLGTTAAAGGAGAANNNAALGPGGAGGALTAAGDGTTAASGGGGGGGAAGIIKLLGAQQQLSGSTISPAPTP